MAGLDVENAVAVGEGMHGRFVDVGNRLNGTTAW